MIRLIQEGKYSLIETKEQTKILTLDNSQTFAWINAAEIGEILVTSYKKHRIDNILSLGSYRLYEVNNEPGITDLFHLELHAGNGTWQGYLLTSGLPDTDKKRGRIIPTDELITKSTF